MPAPGANGERQRARVAVVELVIRDIRRFSGIKQELVLSRRYRQGTELVGAPPGLDDERLDRMSIEAQLEAALAVKC